MHACVNKTDYEFYSERREASLGSPAMEYAIRFGFLIPTFLTCILHSFLLSLFFLCFLLLLHPPSDCRSLPPVPPPLSLSLSLPSPFSLPYLSPYISFLFLFIFVCLFCKHSDSSVGDGMGRRLLQAAFMFLHWFLVYSST